MAIGMGVVSFVGDRGARIDVGSDIQQSRESRTVAGLAAGQMEVEGVPVEVSLEVDLGREAAARATECLVLLPPFAPAAET